MRFNPEHWNDVVSKLSDEQIIGGLNKYIEDYPNSYHAAELRRLLQMYSAMARENENLKRINNKGD